MSTQKLPHLRIPISDKTRLALKQIALNKDTSVAQIARDALQAYFNQQGIQIDMSDGLESWGGAGRNDKED